MQFYTRACGKAVPVLALCETFTVEVLADDVQVQRLQGRNTVIAAP